MIRADDDRIDILIERQIDLLAAIAAADEDQLPALYAMRRRNDWQSEQWLDEAEAVTRA
ncbi:MAG: hypothetical protein H0X64_08300 [Gemmatimonadaceae bacterium]|nr:hypothetical protein [Gemmatimonadaceae bacterium]